jgi:hypothetical protein
VLHPSEQVMVQSFEQSATQLVVQSFAQSTVHESTQSLEQSEEHAKPQLSTSGHPVREKPSTAREGMTTAADFLIKPLLSSFFSFLSGSFLFTLSAIFILLTYNNKLSA